MFLPLSARRHRSPDFTRLSCTETRREIVKQVHRGTSPYVIAANFGLNVRDVFRLLGDDSQDADPQ
jgi:hypothetical protein